MERQRAKKESLDGTYNVQSHCHIKQKVMLSARKRIVKISEISVSGTELYCASSGQLIEIGRILKITYTEAVDGCIQEDRNDSGVISGSPSLTFISRTCAGQIAPNVPKAQRADGRSHHKRSSPTDPIDDEEAENQRAYDLD